jgi:putative transposase
MKRNLVDKTSDLSLNTQLSLLQLAKGSFYYVPKGESEENLAIMRLMDSYILEDPTAGVLTMLDIPEYTDPRTGDSDPPQKVLVL